MRVGDVVTYQDKRWLVTTPRPGKLCLLRSWDGNETEVPAAFDKDPESGLKLVVQSGKWPFLTTPMRTKDGPLVRVTMVREGRRIELVPLVDWVPSSVARPGGPVFLNPELRLQRGEILIAAYKSGKMTRLMVTPAFASVKRRQERAQKANEPPPRRTVYERLMSDDDMFEDDA